MTVPWSDEACSLLTTNSSSKVLSHKVEVQNAVNNWSDLHVHAKNLSRKPGNVYSLPLQEGPRHAHVLLYSFLYLCKFLFFLNVSWMLFSSLSWRRLDILGQLSAQTIRLKDRDSQRVFQTLNWHCIFTYELIHTLDNLKEIKLIKNFGFLA